MLTNIQSLSILAVLCCSVHTAISVNINTALRYGNDSKPIVQCDEYIQEMVAGIYENNFENFDKVIEFSQYSSSPKFRADVLCALYNVMRDVHHTDDPLRALPLYNEIEDLIDTNATNLYSDQLRQLESIRSELLWETIVPKGAEILQAAVYLHTCNHEGTPVGYLLDLLDASNQTVSDLTITRMVNNVRWILPTEELVPILSNFSTHVSQNVNAMLELYNVEEFQGDLQINFLIHLSELQHNPEYNATVSTTKQYQVEAIFPLPLQALLGGGDVCLTQQMSNGSRLYIQECWQTLRACRYVFLRPVPSAVFRVQVERQILAFNFLSSFFSNRPLGIVAGQEEQPGGFKLNVYSGTLNNDINWKVQLDGDQLVVHNMNSTMFLCAGNRASLQGNEWFAYTRGPVSYASHLNECKWTVANCNFVS